MSKLYNTYLALKKQDSQTIYLFKSGIFFIAIDDDARTLSNAFDFKLSNLNNDILKCHPQELSCKLMWQENNGQKS